MLGSLLEAMQMFFQANIMLACAIGAILGFVIGVIPGIGAAMGVALVIPFSLAFPPEVALTLYMAIYAGTQFGGDTLAILMNVPGTGAAAVSALDGFPMAKQGKAVTALQVSTTASMLGGIISPIILIAVLPIMATVVLMFGTPEFFLLGILGITCIAAVSKGGSLLKGLISGCFGLMIATVGIAPVGAEMRYTFGSVHLFDGFGFLPAIIGLFGFAEMLNLIGSENKSVASTMTISGSRWEGFLLTFKNLKILIKCSLIGLFIGIIPGVGAATASPIAWAEAKRGSKDPDSFGKGNPAGVVAAEAANSALVPGTLIPTILFGIPGSGTMAIILGGLMMHGLRPGRDLFRGDGLIMTNMILFSLIMAPIFIFIIVTLIAPYMGKVTLIKKELLIPIIIILASLGIYIIGRSMFEVVLTLCFGILGFFMLKFKIPLFPLILALILGDMIESNYHRSIVLGDGDLWFLFTRPICVGIIVITFLVLFNPLLSKIFRRKKA